jgi:prolyl-tRNA editing enzyme YbaK/EbsC (Cys-tRNA(Pro) deacylase)
VTGRALPPSAARVQDALAARGFANKVIALDRPTRTAADAAAALGCTVAQIAKSLVFRRATDGEPVLVIASGAGRVDEKKVGDALGAPIEKADADFVRDATGFAIGGISPIGHRRAIETLIDADLLTHAEIWAAGGHPNTLFRLTPDELVRMTGARAVAVR